MQYFNTELFTCLVNTHHCHIVNSEMRLSFRIPAPAALSSNNALADPIKSNTKRHRSSTSVSPHQQTGKSHWQSREWARWANYSRLGCRATRDRRNRRKNLWQLPLQLPHFLFFPPSRRRHTAASFRITILALWAVWSVYVGQAAVIAASISQRLYHLDK